MYAVSRSALCVVCVMLRPLCTLCHAPPSVYAVYAVYAVSRSALCVHFSKKERGVTLKNRECWCGAENRSFNQSFNHDLGRTHLESERSHQGRVFDHHRSPHLARLVVYFTHSSISSTIPLPARSG